MTALASWSTSHSGIVAFLAMLVLTPVVIWASRWVGWVDRPRSDRWHEESTPNMGGLAIFASATLGVLWSGLWGELWLLWIGASLVFLVGLIDDVKEVSPTAKIFAQVVATALLVQAGYTFGSDWPVWLSLPLTVLWVVGVSNSINLLDNMDGLAAGVAGFTALLVTLFAASLGSTAVVVLGASAAGAAMGFLPFNFKPARIFMGDCGSLFLGFIVAGLALMIQQDSPVGGPLAAALIPLSVLAVPVFDTTFVTVLRKLSGRSISQGGRDHTSHRLVFLGLSERNAVLLLYGLSVLSGSLALTTLFVDVKLFYAITVFVGVGMVILGIHLASVQVYSLTPEGDTQVASDTRVLDWIQELRGPRWKSIVGTLGDILLVGAAFVVAHYLRFDQGLSPGQESRLVESLPLVVGTKIAVFYLAGLYRGLWRHAGTHEILRTLVGTLFASAGAFVVLVATYGMNGAIPSVLIIDWMITTFVVAGWRFSFLGMEQYFATVRGEGRRLLIYGAGEEGVLALRKIRQNPDRDVTLVAFLDDDPSKHHRTVQGLPVLGGGVDLARLCREHDIDEVIVTGAPISDEQRRSICGSCDAANVDCQLFALVFESMEASSDDPSPTHALAGNGSPPLSST